VFGDMIFNIFTAWIQQCQTVICKDTFNY
jgi:hypothetical protein